MTHTSEKSYLEISDAALEQMKLLLAASPYQDPVIIFYFSNDRISDLGLRPEVLSEPELSRVKEILYSPDFLESSRLHVETASGVNYPDETIVEIGGIPVNAPSSSIESVQPQYLMSFSDGRFQLAEIKA